MAESKRKLSRFAGRTLARLIGHVAKTSDVHYDPPDLLERLRAAHPCIVACWHGQFMLTSMLRPSPDVRVSAMVARHGDAEVIGEAMRQLGVELIRGAGAGTRKKDRGGAAALRASVRALTDGASLVMTADVPPGPARVAGLGIVTIAQFSGRPIVPVAVASSRFTSFDTWSRMTFNLPYSKIALTQGKHIHVPRDATPEDLEKFRAMLDAELNDATRRAYALAGADLDRATPLDQLAAKNAPAPGATLKLYRTGASAMRPLAPLLLKYRARQGKEDPSRQGERLGIASRPRPDGRLVWVHAASVGETNVALPVIEALLGQHADAHVLLTTGTTTSAALASRRLPERAFHQYVPLDSTQYAEAFLAHWKPNLAVFTESEIWPNLILSASARGVPLVLINARMSPRSMRRWQRFARIGRPLFSRFSTVLAQNERIARSIRFLGAPNVIVAGNLKIDAPPPPIDAEALAELRAAIMDRPLLLASSTHAGEEAIVAEADRVLRAKLPDLLTIIVPRHPDRAGQIEADLRAAGSTRILRRSLARVPARETEIYIADTIGELGTFYALAPVAFIGGSLVRHGGQNPIEAVRHGSAVLAGPHTHNFHDAYAALLQQNGAITVNTAAELAEAAGRLIGDASQRAGLLRGAEAALATLSGAMTKTLAALEPYLEGDTGAAARVP